MREMIEQFNENVNKHLNPVWSLDVNDYGAKYDAGFEDTILKLTAKALKKECPRILKYEQGKDAKPEVELITPATFSKWFNKDTFSYAELTAGLLALKKELIVDNIETSTSRTSATNAVLTMIRGEEQIKEISFEFFSNGTMLNKYTKADSEFIFDRIRKDEDDNLYMILDKNQPPYRIEIKPNTERTLLGNTIDVNTQFWPAFFRTFTDKFSEWNRKIKEIVQTFDWTGNKSLEQVLLDEGIPRIYLECHKLNIIMRGVNTGKKIEWVFSNCELVLNSAGSKNYSHSNMIEVFSKHLIDPVDVTRVEKIKLYSNNENELAIKHIKLPEASTSKEEPKLPPMWEKFLGNGRFYDKFMDKMKIACFVHNILNANYSGRQILVLGGAGEDGKGVFLDILGKIIGTEHTAPLTVKAFSAEDEFGLSNVVNKKFVYLSDCKSVSKLFAEDKFKALSGGDSIPINRKYLKPMQWRPQGLCIAIATNNNFYVNSEHGRSRAVPVVFLKNFTREQMIEKSEMEMRLLAEKDEFIKWCVDYRYWLNHYIAKDQLLKGSTLTLCTDQDLKRIAKGETDITTFEMFKNMCEKQQLNDTKFCSWNERTEQEEEVSEGIEEVFNRIWAKHKKQCQGMIIDDETYYKPIDIVVLMNEYIFDFRYGTADKDKEDEQRKNKSVIVGCEPSITHFDCKNKIFNGWLGKWFNVVKGLRDKNNVQYKRLVSPKKELDNIEYEDTTFHDISELHQIINNFEDDDIHNDLNKQYEEESEK